MLFVVPVFLLWYQAFTRLQAFSALSDDFFSADILQHNDLTNLSQTTITQFIVPQSIICYRDY